MNRTKTGRERLIKRSAQIKRSLENQTPEKAAKLKAELRDILLELDARAEAVDEIMKNLEN